VLRARIGLLAGALLLVVRPAAAQEETAGAYTHDGLYVRMSLGGGALNAKFRGGDKAPDSEAKGAAVMLDIMVGGTVLPGFVIGGGYQAEVAADADFEFGSSYTGSGGVLSRLILGPFVEWFPLPKQGFSVGLFGGYTQLELETPEIFGSGGELKTTGFGANLFAGYAPWIAREWSLGAALRGGLTSTRNTDDSTQKGSAWSFGILFTAIYH
jgi:hypothetical protein